MKKIRLSGDILPFLIMGPIGIPIIMILAFFLSKVDDSIGYFPVLFFGVASLLMMVIWILLSKTKDISFDDQKLYIHNIFNNKLIKEIDLEFISSVDFSIFGALIKYKDTEGIIHSIRTILNKRTYDAEAGFTEIKIYDRFWGKHENRMKILRELIKLKKESINE